MRAVLISLFVCGCGDPVPDGTYRGVPLLSVPAVLGRQTINNLSRAQIAVVWTTPALGLESAREVLFTPGELAAPAKWEGNRFRIDLFRAPPAAASLTAGAARVAVGQLWLVDDVDADGKVVPLYPAGGLDVSPPDRLLGVAYGEHVLDVEGAAWRPPDLSPAEPGFHLLSVDCANRVVTARRLDAMDEVKVVLAEGDVTQAAVADHCLDQLFQK